jgi:hypothetical protein
VRVWAIGLDDMYYINENANTELKEYQNSRIKLFYHAYGLGSKNLDLDYSNTFVNFTIFDRKKLVKTKSKQSRFIMVDKN